MGSNEYGVTIGNEAVFTDQPYASRGLTGMDLVRLGLERAATAADAVVVITDLLDRYGQGGGCGHENPSFTYHNSFLIADGCEAYVLETAGKLWEVEHVTEGARSISNGLTIPGFADHNQGVATYLSRARQRRHHTEIRAAHVHSVGGMIDILRSHNDRVIPRYRLTTGAMCSPCMHAGGLVVNSQTTGSWIADLGPDHHQHWVTGTAAPCTGIFKPVLVTEPLDLGPDAGDRYDPSSMWWRHEVLHRAVMTDPARLGALYRSTRDELECRWLADPPDSVAAFAEAATLTEEWTLTVLDHLDRDTRPLYARRYWTIRNRRAGVPIVPRTPKPSG